MYKDISQTVEALNSLKFSTANNRVCREQIENLSAGLQNDNIEVGESVQKRFNTNMYSQSPSSISVDDALYIKRSIERDIIDLADNNRREALSSAINAISSLNAKIKHITELKDPDLSKLETIKEYYNRPKMKFDVFEGSLKEDIECEFIPLEIFNNRDQLSVFKNLTSESSEANYLLEAIYSNAPMYFYAFLNWICKALKDSEIVNSDYNWRMLFENNSVAPVDLTLISEAVIDGRLADALRRLKDALELELSCSILDKVDALKTIHLATKTIETTKGLDSLTYSGVFDKMYKDNISLLFIEFLYTVIYCKHKN